MSEPVDLDRETVVLLQKLADEDYDDDPDVASVISQLTKDAYKELQQREEAAEKRREKLQREVFDGRGGSEDSSTDDAELSHDEKVAQKQEEMREKFR